MLPFYYITEKLGDENVRKLLNDICNCNNLKKSLDGDKSNCCYKIVNTQNKEEFQLPEPWNGDLVNAPIMIIGSNPSINEDEFYPEYAWSEEAKLDFHNNRFFNKWVKDQKYVLLKDGNYATKSVAYWNKIRARVKEILPKDEIFMGQDFSLVELVRCKSKKEIGVKNAINQCLNNFFEKTLEKSNCEIIICFGKKPEKALKKFYKLEDKKYFEKIKIGGKDRVLVFIPHPCGSKPQKLELNLSFEEISKMKMILKKYL